MSQRASQPTTLLHSYKYNTHTQRKSLTFHDHHPLVQPGPARLAVELLVLINWIGGAAIELISTVRHFSALMADQGFDPLTSVVRDQHYTTRLCKIE